MEKKKYKLIYLEWQDAHSNAGWIDEDKVKNFEKEVCIVKECGFIHTETDKELIMFSRYTDYHSDDEVNGRQLGLVQKIPTTWIRKRIELGEYEL